MTVGSHNQRVYFLSSVCFLVLIYAKNNNEKRRKQQDARKSVSQVLLNPVVAVGRWKFVVYWSEVWCFAVPLRIMLSLRLRTAWDGIKTRRDVRRNHERRTTHSAAERIRLTADLCTEWSANAAAFPNLIKFADDRCELCKRELVCFMSCWLQTGRAADREQARNNGCQTSLRHSNTR